MLNVIEFFSGIGGMHYALKETGKKYQIIAAFDINEKANECYRYNFKLTPNQCLIEHFPFDRLDAFKAQVWLMSPPCQPFTRGGNLLDDKDSRSTGLLYLISILPKLAHKPKYIFLENVLNFERSECRNYLVSILRKLNYNVNEYIISPCVSPVNIPNNRERYYLTAKLVLNAEHIVTDNEIIRNLGNEECGIQHSLSEYLLPEGNDSKYLVPLSTLERVKNFRHDVVHPNSKKSSTFTKAYGSKHIIGVGSLLQTKCFQEHFDISNNNDLIKMGVRYFTANEIALLHGFPLRKGFEFPSTFSDIEKWRLIGNSLNVKVVCNILERLITEE